jgi:RNA polymerase sigma-70 factor, ECF subfamily
VEVSGAAMQDAGFARLLDDARAGGGIELGCLLESFRPLLMRMANERLGPRIRLRISGSDLVQETLLSATQNFVSFRGGSPYELQAWLMRIFRARLNDGLRRHLFAERRRVAAQQSSGVSSCKATSPSPSTQAVLNERTAALLTALSNLDEVGRRVVLLRYVDQLGFEAIAQQLDLPLTTVWRRWQQAVEQLRDRLGNG